MCAKRTKKKEGVVNKVVNAVKKMVSGENKKPDSENQDVVEDTGLIPETIRTFYNEVLAKFPTNDTDESPSDTEILNRCVVAIVSCEIERYMDVLKELPEDKFIFTSDKEWLLLINLKTNALGGDRYKLRYWNKGYGDNTYAETYFNFKLFVEPNASVFNHIDHVHKRFDVGLPVLKNDITYLITYIRNSIQTL